MSKPKKKQDRCSTAPTKRFVPRVSMDSWRSSDLIRSASLNLQPTSAPRAAASSVSINQQDQEREVKRAIILRDYHDQPFLERNYGAIRGLFESPTRRTLRHEGIAFLGEFIGTFSFLFMGLMIAQIACTKNSKVVDNPENIDKSKLLMISFGFGISLMVQVFIWFRVTGGQFNPAVSLALCALGINKPARFITCVIAQMVAGIVAAFAVDLLTVGGLSVALRLAQSSNSRTSVVQGFFIELIGTAQLVLTILFTAVEKHRVTPMAPFIIGFSLLLIHLMAVNYTGSGVNPARALGTAVVSGEFEALWLYIVAPLLGALLATGLYAFVKWAGYQDVNPGQDDHRPPEADYVLPLDQDQDAI